MTPAGGTITAATPLQPQPMRRDRKGGRLYLPDPHDAEYQLTPKRLQRLVKIEALKPRKLPWHIEPSLDQGNTDECVPHTGVHSLQAAPLQHLLNWPRAKITELYDRARRIDGFPMPHDGTTARAVCEILRQDGLLSEYLWIFDEDALKEHLKVRGPVMMGIDWFESMFAADKHGYLTPSGNVAGGHETLIRWYYPPSHKKYPDTYEVQNSWGREWGDHGLYRLKADTLRYLVFALNGDLCLAVEKPIVRPDIHAPAKAA
jgi:hypothetical protein